MKTESMNLKNRKKTYMGGAGGRNGKGEVVYLHYNLKRLWGVEKN